MKTIISAFIFWVLMPIAEEGSLADLRFLEGTWKTENKESYEVWKKTDNGALEGHAYKMKAGEKAITEYLSIKLVDGKITYLARVPNQNSNQTIPFTLNAAVKDRFSFENPAHDFPKKIQYKPLDEKTIQVSVLGADDKGFSYKVIRQ